MADLSTQALLQFTQLVLFLEQWKGLVKTLWDLQEYSVKHGINTISVKELIVMVIHFFSSCLCSPRQRTLIVKNSEFKVSSGRCENVTSSLLPYMHLFQDVLEFMWLCPGQSCSHITEVDGVIHHSLTSLHHLEDRLSDTQEHTQNSYRTLWWHTLNLLMRGLFHSSFRFFLQFLLHAWQIVWWY